MIYLLLAIISSGLIAIIFKFSEGKNSNRFAINTFNYTIATGISILFLYGNRINPLFRLSWFTSVLKESNDVFLNGSIFSNDASLGWGMVLGVITGAFYFLAFYLYQYNVKNNGAALSATFIRLGILIPTLLSLFIFKEYLSPIQWIGMVFSVIGIITLSLAREKQVVNQFNIALLLLFLIGGFADFNAKLFEQFTNEKYESLFVFYIFFTALIISIIMLMIKNRRIHKRDVLVGLLVGIPNQLTSVFILKSLLYLPGALVFPVFSAGSIVFVNVVNILYFKEKLSRNQYFGLLIIVISLILLNIV